jgi:hypothetical protein
MQNLYLSREMGKMKRLLFTLLLGLCACGGSESNAPLESAVGMWRVATIGGQSLPVRINSNDVTAAYFDIRSTGSFTQSTTFRAISNGALSVQVSDGTWTESGGTIVFKYPGGFSDEIGARAGNTLTVNYGQPWVFVR